MNKKFFLALTVLATLMLVSNAFALYALDVNGYVAGAGNESGTLENAVICGADDGNFAVKITGATAGKMFRFKVGSNAVTGASGLRLYDKGAGDTNADAGYASAAGDLTVYVQIPSTFAEGSFDLNGQDVNGGTETAIESIQVKPASTYSEFTVTGDTLGFCRITNYASVSNFKLVDSSSNSIQFTQAVDVSGDLGFNAGVNLANDSAEVTESMTTLVGKAATLTFPNLITANLPSSDASQLRVWFTPTPVEGEQTCPSNKCGTLDVANGTATLNVTGFSKYRLDRADSVGHAPSTFLPQSISGTVDIGGAQVSTAMILLVLVVVLGIGAYMLFKK